MLSTAPSADRASCPDIVTRWRVAQTLAFFKDLFDLARVVSRRMTDLLQIHSWPDQFPLYWNSPRSGRAWGSLLGIWGDLEKNGHHLVRVTMGSTGLDTYLILGGAPQFSPGLGKF